MPQHAYKPRDYLESPHERRLRDWATFPAPIPLLETHRTCSPASALVQQRRASLEDLLKVILGDDFTRRFAMMREGAEFRIFASDELVAQLAIAMREQPDATSKVERALDEVFACFQAGERFDQTEQVAAVLYALNEARPVGFGDVLDVFARSRRVEFSQLRRFVVRLLRH